MKCLLSCIFSIAILFFLLTYPATATPPPDSLGHITGAPPPTRQLPARTRPAQLLAVAEPLAPHAQQRRQELAPTSDAATRTESRAVHDAATQLAQDYQREHFALLQTQERLRTAEHGRQLAWLGMAGLAAALLLALGLGWWASRQQRLRAERATQLRLRLAAELHAEVGSLLTRVSQQADLLSQRQLEPSADLAHLAGTSRAAAHTMHDIVWSIDTEADTVGALVNRMREHLDQTAAPAGLLTEVQADGLRAAQPLRPELRQQLYLIFKEAVANALRHAVQPTKLVVTLTHYAVANALMLAVEDDGQASMRAARPGAGLRTMHERAQALRGTLEVGVQPQGGFRVWLQIPF